MGCGNAKEKLEDEMMKAKMARIEIQYERKKQLELLKDIDGIEHESPIIPDYIEMTPNGKNMKGKRKIILIKRHKSKLMKYPKRSVSFKIKKNEISKVDTFNETKTRNSMKIIKKRKTINVN